MRKLLLLSFCLLFLAASLSQAASTQDCNSDCLRSMTTTYLDVMLKHDPVLLPLTENVRFTEDHNDMSLGEGLWNSIEGLGTFRQDVVDVRNSTAGVHVTAYENGKRIRLKIENGLISEVETSVVSSSEEGMIFNVDSIVNASVAMNLIPSVAQRNSREEMIRLALLHPAALIVGSFVTADAYRF